MGFNQSMRLLWKQHEYIRRAAMRVDHYCKEKDLNNEIKSNLRKIWVTGDAGENLVHFLLEGTWELAPGIPHPANKTGCEFLTSSEFVWLLGMDFCNTQLTA